jgi:hypothetical protein
MRQMNREPPQVRDLSNYAADEPAFTRHESGRFESGLTIVVASP